MDEDEDEVVQLTPKDSKCWNCKHGMVLYEHSIERVVLPEIVEGNGFEGESQEHALSETLLSVKQVRSVCMWHPQQAAPTLFMVVLECNRYEANR